MEVLVTALGMGLLHSLWIGLLAYLGVRLLSPLLSSAGARYRLAYGGLWFVVLSSVAAGWLSYGEPSVCDRFVDAGALVIAQWNAGVPDAGLFVTYLAPAAAPYLLLAYALSLPLVLLGFYRDYHRSRFLARRGLTPAPAAWTTGLTTAPCFLSDHAGEVMTVGLRRPVVLFPRALANQLTPDEARSILLHELGHLRHADHWLNHPQQLLRRLAWFHPAVAALSRLADREREYRCDDFVTARTADRRTYATALLTVAGYRHQPANALLLAATKTAFTRRIHRLFAPDSPAPTRRGGFSLLFALTLGLVLAGNLYLEPVATDCPGTDTAALTVVMPGL